MDINVYLCLSKNETPLPRSATKIKMVKVMVFIVYVPREFAAIKHIDWILKLSRLRLNDEWGAILFLKYI